MGFALGGKKTDNSIVLSPGYSGKTNPKKKPAAGKPGPSVGYMGFLHSFIQGSFLRESLWLNILTLENLEAIKVFPAGVGKAPWENMPVGEICLIAKALQESYMGRLLSLSRFILLSENGIHYSEGIAHLGYAEGVTDTSMAVDYSRSKAKVIWTDPERRPWRQLTSLLSFLGNEQKGSFDCRQLMLGLPRAKKNLAEFGIWSGGLRVSSNAGEQYASGLNDFVESEIRLMSILLEKSWFPNFKHEMSELENLSKITYSTTISFFKAQKVEGKEQAKKAEHLFWQLCERKFQELVNACNDNSEKRKKLRQVFAAFVNKAYNTYCPNNTARQMDAWAANRPNLSKYSA